MSIADQAAEHAYTIRGFHEKREADPLSSWQFAVPRLREAFRLFTADDPIDELHARGPNGTGKTLTKAAFVVACAMKRKSLDGCPIPQWRGRVECLQLVLDFPQQLLSVKAAYLKVLGRWPHHARMMGDHLTSIHVMPVGGDPDNEAGWSVIYFMSQKNMQAGTGARADVIDFDEPPRMDFLRELRKAGHAGRRSIVIIGETPTKRREWAPLREDYGDTSRRTLRSRWRMSEENPPHWTGFLLRCGSSRSEAGLITWLSTQPRVLTTTPTILSAFIYPTTKPENL